MDARERAEEQAAHYPAEGRPGNAIDDDPVFDRRADRKGPTAAPPAVKLKDSELPVISAMDYDDMDQARTLIEEAVMYQEQIAAATDAMKFTKERLAALAQAYEMKNGMRYGQTAIRIQFGQTRRTLDKGLLLLNKCPADAIEKSMKEGRPYDVVTVVADMTRASGAADD